MITGHILSVCPARIMYKAVTHVLAELELPPGNYLAYAKADVMSSMTASPGAFQGLGNAQLTLGGRDDEATNVLGVTDSSGNRLDGARFETIALHLGAVLNSGGTIRLLYTPLHFSTLPITVKNIKVSAISLDGLKITDIECHPQTFDGSEA